MRNYLQLPQFQPGDTRINTAPLANALEAYGNKSMQFNQIERQNEQQKYQRGRDALQDQRVAKADSRNDAEWYGKAAMAVDRLQGPERQAAWQKVIAGQGNLTPEEMDYRTGPKILMAQVGQYRDPREDKLMDLKVAQAQRELTQPVGGTETFFGSPQYEEAKDGKVRAFVLGNRGTKRYVDADEGGRLLGPEGIAAAKARGTVEGREGAEKRMALPKVETTLKMQEVSDRIVVEDIDRALKISENPWATGFVGNLGNYVANTPGSNLSRMLDGIQANIGFDKLQDMRNNSPTGGALGAVTERELALLQSVYGSLVNSQSTDELQFNLNRLKQIRQEYSALRRQAYDRDVQMFGAGAVPNPETGAAPQSASQSDPRTALKQKYGVDLE